MFAICFCIPSYAHQQLHSLDCPNFVYHNSLVFFTYLGALLVQGLIFERGPTIYKKFKNTICTGVCTLMCTEKRFIHFTPSIFSLICPPYRIYRRPCIYPLKGTVSYVSQKLCVFQPSSPLYSIHPLRSGHNKSKQGCRSLTFQKRIL